MRPCLLCVYAVEHANIIVIRPVCMKYWGVQHSALCTMGTCCGWQTYHAYIYISFAHCLTVYVGLAQARPNKSWSASGSLLIYKVISCECALRVYMYMCMKINLLCYRRHIFCLKQDRITCFRTSPRLPIVFVCTIIGCLQTSPNNSLCVQNCAF